MKPENPRYLMTKAEILYQREQLDDVAQLLEKITKLRPSNTEYMFALAKIYREI
jgi:cytochrome c-type biogenesis protein CcmH/NrfG